MQLVEHHALEAAEQVRGVGAGQQQRQLLGRGEQDVGRIAALALALRGRRVAGAGLDAVGSPISRTASPGCARCRRRAPSAAKCRACAGPAPQFLAGRNYPAGLGAPLVNSTSVGRNPASVLPPPVGAISSTERPSRARASNRADARAASSRAREPARKISGSSGAASIFFAETHVRRFYLRNRLFHELSL